MYLVLSLVFFLVASLDDPGKGVALNIDEGGTNIQLRDGSTPPDGAAAPPPDAAESPATAPAPQATPAAPAPKPALDAETKRLVEQLVKRVPGEAQQDLRAELEASLAAATPEEREAARKLVQDPCGERSLHIEGGPLFEQYEPRLRDACRKIVADQDSFGRALWNNIPKMMFLFLPLIAAAMSALYLRSGRYYVEHLLFVVHFHAFFFLSGIAVLLLERLAEMTSGALASVLSVAQGLLGAALTIYVPLYLLKAMRRVYEQSWWKTLPKYAMLGLAYFVSLLFTGLGLLAYTALTL
jgi:hypothetical protein